jgi:prolyl oligopeptidase
MIYSTYIKTTIMKKYYFNLVLYLVLSKMISQNAPKQTVTDNYFNQEIIDNYRNFENLKDTTILNWIKSTSINDLKKLNQIINKQSIYNKINEIYTSRQFSYNLVNYTGDIVFYKKTNTITKKEHLYYKEINKDIEISININDLLINENYFISYIKPNNKGNILAIAITEDGKQLTKIHLYDIINNKLLPHVIDYNWVSELGGIHWLDDDSGFYYTRLQSNDISNKDYLKNNKAVLYLLDETKNKNQVVFSKDDVKDSNNEEDFFIIDKIEKNYIFSKVTGVDKFFNYYFLQKNKNNKWYKLYDKKDFVNKFEIVNNDIYYLSNLNNKNVISKTNINEKKFQNQKIIVTPPKDEVIVNLLCVGKYKYFTTIKNGIQAFMYEFTDNGYKKLDLPFQAGAISRIYQKQKNKNELIVILSGWTTPSVRYIFNPKNKTFKDEGVIEKYKISGLENIIVEEVEVKTHDGLYMPVSIIYNKEMVKNGKNKTIITAYGAYGTIDRPTFNFVNLLWSLNGGIYVIAHVRGGGSKGESWHKGGYKATKSNSWKDLISATEFLIQEKYTSPDFVGLIGVSAGGITVSNAVIERPELFKTAYIESPFINMVRAESSANGANNAKEFGSIKNADEFPHLLKMDAYHKLKPNVKYPTMLVYSGMNDNRVPAWHGAKFVAKLKEYNQEVYFECEIEGGHSGSSINNNLISFANIQAFFYWQLGHPDYQMKE